MTTTTTTAATTRTATRRTGLGGLLDAIREKRPNAFDHFITAVVAGSGVLVGLQTNATMMDAHAQLLEDLDDLVVAIFTLELLFKVVLEGKRPWRYFLNHRHADDHEPRLLDIDRIDFWHVFDFTIVV